ncbi:protein phosphatase 2C domain-containing protein [Nocardiopsis lambiniae]|uniref:Protein phosphatase 2C domain-containing protein n=1 Tax=Nocardiopsis lambiniae TaxID=3075539 RepID=A0ABU2M2J1_9ACTN|nr:protein phosphatase 2C domain-containing protein [Nocardiopsis sp. DSM 44743]MDT0326864.1 protein phosphatase 2C domain-containing protein [Nocardiopsis sp. DSM 44743]
MPRDDLPDPDPTPVSDEGKGVEPTGDPVEVTRCVPGGDGAEAVDTPPPEERAYAVKPTFDFTEALVFDPDTTDTVIMRRRYRDVAADSPVEREHPTVIVRKDGVGGAPRALTETDPEPGADEGGRTDVAPQRTGTGRTLDVPPAAGHARKVDGSRGFEPSPVLTHPVPTAYRARELPGQEWAVPDTVVDEADYERVRLRAASLRGDKHRYEGRTRQDAFGMYEVEHRGERFVLLCVADGVGSRSRSHRGAAYASRCFRAAVAEHIGEIIVRDASMADVREWGRRMLGIVARGMIDFADKEGFPAEDLSTTLTVSLIHGISGSGPAWYMTWGIGDSPVFLLRDGVWEPRPGASDGDPIIVDTRTDALPGRVSTVHMTDGTLAPGDVLVLCTDGLAGPMAADAVADRLAEWWGSGRVPGRMEFAWQLDFQAKSYSDDRTAVCVWGI